MSKATPFSLGTRVLAAGAAVLLLFLLVGFLLPATWTAERSVRIDAPPQVVFRWLDSPVAWTRWTPWPDSGLVVAGPSHGVGATMAWDNPELGDGRFEVVAAEPPTTVRYQVQVQKGRLKTDGTLRLEARDGGTLLTWREDGDFGHNPLMGYWARAMNKVQGRELEKDLAKLKTLVEDGTSPDEPADSMSAGPSGADLSSDSAAPGGVTHR